VRYSEVGQAEYFNFLHNKIAKISFNNEVCSQLGACLNYFYFHKTSFLNVEVAL
jgi:hypothetical protein